MRLLTLLGLLLFAWGAQAQLLDFDSCRVDGFNQVPDYEKMHYAQLIRTDEAGNLLPHCRPDTLYMWMDRGRFSYLSTYFGHQDRPWHPPLGPLYWARAPLTTFGYGPIAIRVKLMPNVIFFGLPSVLRNCNHMDATRGESFVYFRTDGRWGDWSTCSSNVIHSWSYGTAEHLRELEEDYHAYLTAKSIYDVILYGVVQYEWGLIRADQPFRANPDGHDFTEAVLLSRFSEFRRMVVEGSGEIFFNPNVPMEERTRESHFSTNYPVYFNRE